MVIRLSARTLPELAGYYKVMAIFETNQLVAAGQAAQAEVVDGLDKQPYLLIARYFDPANPGLYKPTGSYAVQLRNHGTSIGAATDQLVIEPHNKAHMLEALERELDNEELTGFMALYPLPDDIRERIFEFLRERPELDTDDLLGRRLAAPTARSMIAAANLCLNGNASSGGADYFTGKQLGRLSTLDLPEGWSVENMRFGGRGYLTNAPLLRMLGKQGIEVPDEQVATAETPERLVDLPDPALIFTATPQAEQIRDRDIPDGSIVIDAGFGRREGVTYGNTEEAVKDRQGVLWTPPVRGVGPGSTLYFYNNLLESAGVPPAQFPALGETAISAATDHKQ